MSRYRKILKLYIKRKKSDVDQCEQYATLCKREIIPECLLAWKETQTNNSGGEMDGNWRLRDATEGRLLWKRFRYLLMF